MFEAHGKFDGNYLRLVFTKLDGKDDREIRKHIKDRKKRD